MRSRKFTQGRGGFAHIRDRFSRKFRTEFTRIREGFTQSSRRICDAFAQVHARSRRVRASLRRIRESSAPSSHAFRVYVLRKFATDSGFAPDIPQFRDANARRCGVTSPVRKTNLAPRTGTRACPVSYTHLTLPTICSV
eukprot:6425934-Prymnesium_polylepis.1